MQFNIRFLLLLTLAFALAIALIQNVIERHSEFLLPALFAAFVFAMYGLVLVALSGTMAVAILVSAVDENRGENLRQCAMMAGAGVIAVAPMILWLVFLSGILK